MERAICKYRVATRVGIERVHNRDPLFFPRVLPYESIKRGRSEEESRGRIDEYGFSNKTRGDRRRVTRRLSRFHVAFYRRFNVDPFFPPPSPLNDPKKERRSFEPFASFFFSRGTQQWWTEDGPDGRHGRCAAQTARTPGEDPVTSRHPATVDDLARGGTPAWRIAPAACATVSHEILSHPLVTTLFDAPSGHTHVKKTPCCYRLYRKVDITVF